MSRGEYSSHFFVYCICTLSFIFLLVIAFFFFSFFFSFPILFTNIKKINRCSFISICLFLFINQRKHEHLSQFLQFTMSLILLKEQICNNMQQHGWTSGVYCSLYLALHVAGYGYPWLPVLRQCFSSGEAADGHTTYKARPSTKLTNNYLERPRPTDLITFWPWLRR